MTLRAKQTFPFEPQTLATGAGAFATRGGRGKENTRIVVHFYKPRSFHQGSPVLLVIPGAGRDGDEYRDAWIETAERAGVLIAAPTYAAADYDFAAYHMGGVVRDLVIRNMPRGADGEPLDVLHVRDEDISFSFNPRREQWLFHDFDRIFAFLARATGSARSGYDIFGHSAGGQILHRLALFHPATRAERIVAANSGFYTLPDLDLPLPVGLADTGVDAASLRRSLACRLVLLLGENDDGDGAGGTQLHTPLIDRQGIGRLTRGRYFLRAGETAAQALGAPFNWTLQTVPGVGHNFHGMSAAAARLLYPG